MTPFVLWIVLLPTAASKFVVELTPKNPMARVGDRLVLTCSASDCAEAVTFTWGSLLDQPLNGKTETNGSVSLQIFNPLGVKHRNKVVCKATCRTTTTEQKAQMSTEVKVYALPKDPTLSRSDLLTEGQESNLTCTVPDVYPADSLIIEWLLGDEVLLKQDGHLDGQMVTSVFKYRPTAQNNGQNVTCRATLDIEIGGITRETVASMTVQYSPRNTTISGNTQVNIGDSFTLTCRAEGNPEPTVLWRRLDQDGRSVVEGEGMTLLVEEASWSHGGEYECVAHNVVGNQTAHMTVNVQGPPEKPVLSLSPSGELKAMDSVTITCQSESGPQGRVALRQVTGGQGAELQSNQSHTSTSITVQLLTAKNSGLYECQVTNPYGKQTSSINLTVSAPPTNLSTEFKEGQNVTVWRPAVGVPAPSATLVRLQDGVEPHSSDGSFHLVPEQASKFVVELTPKNPMARVGDRLVLTCSASDCAEAVTFTWGSLLDQPLNGKTETNGSVSLQIFNPLGVKHRNKVVCKATCRTTGQKAQNTGPKAQMSTEVKVYALPKDPTLSRSDLLTEGQESNLTCTVPDVYPADSLIIEWLLGDEVLLKQDGHLDGQMVTSVFKYRPTAQNNGQNVTCRATLDIEIGGITRETVASMTVQYSPRNTTISGNTQVNIGDSFTLTCRAEGNPEPTVLWRRLDQDGRSVVEGEGMTLLVEEASWSHGGEYECVAHNVVGNQTAHMTVNVQGPPEKPVLSLSPSGELKAMDSVTITCQSESGPQGRVALRQVTGGQGAELQSNQSHTSTSITVQLLTAKNSGLYECQVTNPYGKQTSSINLTVSAPPTNLSTEFKEGQNVTVWRPAVGVPAPSATLVRLQDGVEPHSSDGSFHLVPEQALPKDPTLSRSDLLTEGQESNLTCTVPDVYPADRLIIEWLLGDEVLLKQDGHLDGQMVTSVFKYRPTAQNNGQNVTCRATLDNRITRETVASMTVQYSPRNTTISGNTQVNIGDSFTLTCRAEGNPEPTVLWRRLDQDGRSVVEGEGMTLLVEEASWSHGGEYECVAHNVVGNQTAHMTVNVQGPPEKPVLYLSPSGELKAMDSVTITCQSESGPQGRVALRQVTGGQGAELQSNQSHTSTSITVQLLTAKNSGLYECQVTNPYGKQTSSINLTVSAPPTNLSTEFKEGQNVTVWRPAVGVPAPSATLVRLQDGVEPHSSDGSFHLVPEQDKPVSAKAIIIPAMCSVSIVTAAAILIRFLRRAKTSSSYEVARIV